VSSAVEHGTRWLNDPMPAVKRTKVVCRSFKHS